MRFESRYTLDAAMPAGLGMRRIMLQKYRLAPIIVFVIFVMLFPTGSNGPLPAVRAAGFCDWAGFVMDVTVPDATIVAPNTPLTKTWRLKNIGTCSWTMAYAV